MWTKVAAFGIRPRCRKGVRETVSRRLSRLPEETNKALAAAAVVGSRFALDLVERVVDEDLVDAFDEACKAGIVIEEPGGRYRFNHAIVRQSLLAELASVRRMRLHQRIATTLENQPGADDELLAELAHHYFECAWAGNAAKAVTTAGAPQTRRWHDSPTKAPPTCTTVPCTRWRRLTRSCPTATTRPPNY